jgi:DNA helicase HerA-like ATPase
VLLSKILDLNDTQEGLLAMMFKYCDDKRLPLLDLKDLKAVIQYISDEGKDEIEKTYGAISTTSSGTILRKVIELEQQGAEGFFGELSFDPHDLLRTDTTGKAYINIIRLTDIQDKPKLFSTFMLSLLAEIYSSFPEIGDPDKPKLVIFIDEAHLIFDEASKQLLNQIETTIKLIRSKGIGVIFCTQNPQDIPAAVLSQLGLKIQHALRAFTAADRKTIKTAAENFPLSDYYKTDEILTQLGIGEALVTALNEKGIPTMLTATMMCSPSSRMDVLSESEIQELVHQSQLVRIYNQEMDRESAFELLNKRIQEQSKDDADSNKKNTATKTKEEAGTFEKLLKSPVVRSMGVAVAGMVTRSLLGSLGLKTRSRTTRKK